MLKNKDLQDAFQFVAEQAWESFSKDFFDALTSYIGEKFDVDYVIVDKLVSNGCAETLSLFAKGKISPNLKYDLIGTPCENVVGRKFCFYPNDIQILFPDDHLLVEMAAESYMGIPLWDSKNNPNGLIVLINCGEFRNPEVIKNVLQVFASRAGAEIERRQFEEKLKEREQHLSLLLDSTKEAIYGLDIDGKCTFANRSCIEVLGYSYESELIGQKMHDLIHHTTEEGHHYPLEQCKIYKSFRTADAIYEDNEILWKKDGTSFPVEYWSHPILKEGKVVGSVVTFLDITERKKLLEEHKRTAQLAALGTVAAGVAHEINNPIQGIMNYAEILERKPDDPERVKKAAKRIKDESKGIAKITEDLLFYAKENKKGLECIDVRETVESALSLISTRLKNNNVTLDVDIQDNLPNLCLQPQGLKQVVINLIENAFDALKDKEETTEKNISIVFRLIGSVDESDAVLSVEVQDNGRGMSKETLGKSQDAFFTTKPPSDGTGLGLSIVTDIIKNHNGRLEIESKEGEFTKIKAMFPAIEETQPG